MLENKILSPGLPYPRWSVQLLEVGTGESRFNSFVFNTSTPPGSIGKIQREVVMCGLVSPFVQFLSPLHTTPSPEWCYLTLYSLYVPFSSPTNSSEVP
jgi:hypothetical protein